MCEDVCCSDFSCHALIVRFPSLGTAVLLERSCACYAASHTFFWVVLQVQDLALQDYIAVKTVPVYVPHTAGRYQKKRFRKAQCPIVERYVHVATK
jgi:hypothetical protein